MSQPDSGLKSESSESVNFIKQSGQSNSWTFIQLAKNQDGCTTTYVFFWNLLSIWQEIHSLLRNRKTHSTYLKLCLFLILLGQMYFQEKKSHLATENLCCLLLKHECYNFCNKLSTRIRAPEYFFSIRWINFLGYFLGGVKNTSKHPYEIA